ncbi:MAG: type I restriction-modification system subunit M [Treponema sp.]|nr:type I restriction-modification system subunit M [Treponema sp.]
MNKQQLASKIWESANKMRSKIEANEYKDYILGFIFYKYLSDREVSYLKKEHYSDEDIIKLTNDDKEDREHIRKNLGYFISYDSLFSTWIDPKSKFSVKNVQTALTNFAVYIEDSKRKVFEGIFDSLESGLTKLGTSTAEQTKAVSDLLQLIKGIPMDGKQDYDVLGFVYEYLISQFAANAGKKAGEFYTPHEVSLLMAEIVAEHLKNKEQIKIYDPTSGSGSLLINIGRAAGKYIDPKKIVYYAQELKQNTYNLTRMNLIMRGINPSNITTRNGDTLAKDWPYFDENNPENTYNPLFVDAVVSNPPYSQKWDNKDMSANVRFKEYGLAPKGKADYAFLLHDLYHLQPDGIETIVLPHGVLFRGKSDDKSEGQIRSTLIEKNRIDAIIGLPPNIFFGTGIPTIIMILKKQKQDDNVLIVDASRHFIKAGKNNKLQESDIKRIVDVVVQRKSVAKFSRLVRRDEIRKNDYNLNIPRYVDSGECPESYDMYATMFGGCPDREIDLFSELWTAFPSLKNELFEESTIPYHQLRTSDIKDTVFKNDGVKAWTKKFESKFKDFKQYLNSELIVPVLEVNISRVEDTVSESIFTRLKNIPLIDNYQAFQAFDDSWQIISTDIEVIQTEGLNAARQVDPNMITRKKGEEEYTVQDGWTGHILPFELVQKKFLKIDLDALEALQDKIRKIQSEYDELIADLTEDERELNILKDDENLFDFKEVESKILENYADVESEEIEALRKYNGLSVKEKKAYQVVSNVIDWGKLEISKTGVYTKTAVNTRILELQKEHQFEAGSTEAKLVYIYSRLCEEKDLSKKLKAAENELHERTKTVIENLSDEQVHEMLSLKWIEPLDSRIHRLPDEVINNFVVKLELLKKKYETTYVHVAEDIKKAEKKISDMINKLTGDEFDMKGLKEFQKLLNGGN